MRRHHVSYREDPDGTSEDLRPGSTMSGGTFKRNHVRLTGIGGARAWGFCLSRRTGATTGRE